MEKTSLQVSLTKKEFIKYSLRSEYLYSPTLLKFIPVYLIFITMALLSFFYYHNMQAGAFVVFVGIAAPISMFVIIISSLQKEYTLTWAKPYQLTFGEDSFTYTDGEDEAEYTPDLIHKIYEDHEALYIYLTTYICIFIPTTNNDEETLKQIREYLENYMKSVQLPNS